MSSLNGLAPQEIAESVEVDGLPGCLAETDPKYEEKWASLAYRVGMNSFVYDLTHKAVWRAAQKHLTREPEKRLWFRKSRAKPRCRSHPV